MNSYTLTLKAIPKTEHLPESISVLCKKGDEIAKIFGDGCVSVNGKDLFKSEWDQIAVVRDNFDMFYKNIKTDL